MKLIIDIPNEGYDWIKNGFPDNEDKEFLIKAVKNGTPYEEKPFEINVFLENADESTLFDIKKQLSQILTDRAEKEAYEEARREAMKLDDNEDSLRWRFTH